MNTRKAKILIVEDESIIAEDLRDCLTERGYHICDIVNSGVDAYAAVERSQPDLALVDIHLKGNVDGTEVGRTLREEYGVPFIYVTAYAGDKTLEKVKPTDPSGYIVKPFNERELHTVVELALHKEKTRKEQEKRYEWMNSTLESIGEAIIATDASQEIVFMNRSAEILTGWRGAEAIGQKLSDVLAVKFRNEDGTTLDRIEEIYPNHLTLARVKNALLKNKDSGFFGIDYTVTPICDSESECLGVVVVARDAASKGSGYARNIE